MSELVRYLLSTREAFKDPRRLHSLYGDFSTHQHSNPEGYQANIDEWRNALVAAAREGVIPGDPTAKELADSRFVVGTGEFLLQALETRQFGIPVALGRVVEDAVKNRQFIEMNEYKTAQGSILQKRWMPHIPSLSQVLVWTWRQVGFGSQSQSLLKGQWVIPANLEAASTLILKALESSSSSPTDSIHTLSSLRAALPFPFTDSDISLLLTYLSRDKPRLTYKYINDTEAVIKLGTTPLSETDLTIANLKVLDESISRQLVSLETAMNNLAMQAKQAVEAKNTSAARSALRRKKVISGTLDKRRDEAFTVQQTLIKIDQAVDQVALVRVMQASASTLKQLNKEVGGVEGAEKVTNELAEQMDITDEIGQVINEPGVGVVDEMEVDDEFEALLKENEDKKRKEREEKERRAKEEETKKKMWELEEWEAEQKKLQSSQTVEEEKDVDKTTQKIAQLSI